MKIVIKSGGQVVREKELRNLDHFNVQRTTRATVIESKKTYRRERQKDMMRKTNEGW